jgi:hypothetical protein
MSRLHVEGWAPEYGASVEPDEGLSPAEGAVDVAVEDRPWEPIPGVDDGIPVIAFVDGVRRIEARLVLDAPNGPVAGICGSFGVGAVVWRRDEVRSTVERPRVERMAILSSGHAPAVPELPMGLSYRSSSVPGDDPASLIEAFHDAMRRAEAELAEDLGRSGYFVVADGPLYEYTDVPKIGYIKSHRRSYLPDTHAGIIGDLPGPSHFAFTIGEARFRRYSCTCAWSTAGRGIVAAMPGEASAALLLATVAATADRATASSRWWGRCPTSTRGLPRTWCQSRRWSATCGIASVIPDWCCGHCAPHWRRRHDRGAGDRKPAHQHP